MKNFRILLLVLPVLLTANFAPGQNWTLISGTINIYSSAITCSADGSKLAAASWNGATHAIYISTNSGITWLPSGAPSLSWSSIASSADGSRLAAATFNGIYTSTNSGTSWTSNNVPVRNDWMIVAVSADGSRLAAAAGQFSSSGGPICITTNSGNTWTQTSAPITNWSSMASSADGSILLAGTFGGPAYLSTNSGDNWIQQTNLPAARWTVMATSANGKMLMAAAEQVGSGFGRIYISTNSGIVWTQANVPTNQYLWAFGSSADGAKMAAINGSFFYSTDSGNTWMSNSVPSSAKWGGMAFSADGSKLVLVANGPGGIYTSHSPPAPHLNLTPANGNLMLSWTVPSTNFGLQQSPDLSSWTDVTNSPVLNLTNLQNEVILAPTGSSGFYRLKTP